jgi:hypothetical protein
LTTERESKTITLKHKSILIVILLFDLGKIRSSSLSVAERDRIRETK